MVSTFYRSYLVNINLYIDTTDIYTLKLLLNICYTDWIKTTIITLVDIHICVHVDDDGDVNRGIFLFTLLSCIFIDETRDMSSQSLTNCLLFLFPFFVLHFGFWLLGLNLFSCCHPHWFGEVQNHSQRIVRFG